MRTVDPLLWDKKVKKPPIAELGGPLRFARRSRSAGVEARLRDTFRQAVGEYLAHSCLWSDGDEKIEWRFRWVLVVCTMACGVGLMVHNCVLFRASPPLLISLQSSQHPISSINFPAIALCSTNVVSKISLQNYTDYIYSLDHKNTYTKEEISQQLVYYGGLIDIVEERGVDELFADFLAALGQLNVTEILYRLSPSCSLMLYRCAWRGRPARCDHLFASRLTPLGYCCVFNSRYSPEDWGTPAHKLDLVGYQYGLVVVARENSDDFLYLRTPSAGFEVLLFDGDEVPLGHGGSLRRLLTTRNSSVFFSISVSAQQAAGGLNTYSDDWRGCRMESARRRRSSCLSACRRAAARALCACELPAPAASAHCTPNHLHCLNKHKEKFLLYYPRESGSIEGLQSVLSEELQSVLSEELEAGLDCSCLPDCTQLSYFARHSHVNYYYQEKLFHQNFSRTKGHDPLVQMTNMTVLRFFYDTEDQLLYSVEGYLRWYEVLATISCQWLFMVGMSLPRALALVFHLTVRWLQLFQDRTRSKQHPSLPTTDRKQ